MIIDYTLLLRTINNITNTISITNILDIIDTYKVTDIINITNIMNMTYILISYQCYVANIIIQSIIYFDI